MSRTKKDRDDTEAMLCRLTVALSEATPSPRPMNYVTSARTDAESLRRISMTLHRWYELECGVDGGGVERVDGKAWWYNSFLGKRTHVVADRERGALKRLAKIMARYPSLQAYVQGDPRGCALYILRPGDVPAGADVSAYYSRGVAVHQ